LSRSAADRISLPNGRRSLPLKNKPFLMSRLYREREPRVDAELVDARNAVAQAAYRHEVEARHAARRIGLGVRLQRFFPPEVFLSQGVRTARGDLR
jgi:hypothetical protein